MTKIYFLLSYLLFFSTMASGQASFSDLFTEKSLRIDFELAGTHQDEWVLLKKLKQEPYWGGNHQNLTNTLNSGDFQLSVSTLSGELLYSKGFNSLFREWQTIGEAQKLTRSFMHCMQVPFPKNNVQIDIASRQHNGQFKTLLSFEVNPDDYLISREMPVGYSVDTLQYFQSPEKQIDLVFLAEGYTQAEQDKFLKDVAKFASYCLELNPFDRYQKRFNIYSIFAPSLESGPDVPGEHIYRQTALNSSFYTFDSPRYLTVPDTEKMADLAALVPYDHIYVLVNTDIYGGSGFYNHYTSCATDCQYAKEIASHELAHGLIGLADEYYSNKNDEIHYFYSLEVEPWEANLTTLVDFDSKWKQWMASDTPIPTPRSAAFSDVLGVFEGGAYQAEGIYSPKQGCKMKTNADKELCKACEQGVIRVLETYLK